MLRLLATGHREERGIPSGPEMTARKMVRGVKRMVLDGGNAKNIEKLPPDTRLGDNKNAFLGGFRLWEKGTTPQPGGHEEKAADKKRIV
jgi:hypothetical protein